MKITKGYIWLSLKSVHMFIHTQERILINKSPIAITVSWTEMVKKGSSTSYPVIKHEIPPQSSTTVILGQMGQFKGNVKVSYKPRTADPFVYEAPIELKQNEKIAFTTVPLTEILKSTQALVIFFGDKEGKFSDSQYKTPPLNRILQRAGRIEQLGN